jgi:hypothetical protein
MPPMPQTSHPLSPPLPLLPHTPIVDDTAPILIATIEGIMRNLAPEDAKAGDAGFRDHNIATKRDGAPAIESVE